MADDTVKISANLPQSTIDQLRWLASQRGTTMTEVLRRAVDHEAFLQDSANNQVQILTRDPKGNMGELIIK
jgi:hypothetical protein